MPFSIFCLAFLAAFFSSTSWGAVNVQPADVNYGGIVGGQGRSLIATEEEESPRTSEEELFQYDEDDYIEDINKLKKFEKKILLKKVVFHGNNIVSTNELNAIAMAYVNRQIGFAELNELKREIYAFCAKKGLIFHRILLPTQEVRDGDVDIWIRETNIHRITVTADKRVRKQIRPYVALLRQAKTRNEYERIFLLMQRLAGFTVRAVVQPIPDQPTKLEMHIVVKENKFRGVLSISNTLLKKDVGPWAAALGLNFDNIIGLNEHWEVSAQVAHPYRELLSLSGSLNLPLGRNGLSALAGVSYFWTEPSVVGVDLVKTETPSGHKASRRRCKFGLAYPFLLRFGKEVSLEAAYYNYYGMKKQYDVRIPISKREDPTYEEETRYDYMRFKLRTKLRAGRVSHIILLSGSYQPSRAAAHKGFAYEGKRRVQLFSDGINRARGVYLAYTLYAALPKNIGFSLLLGGQYSFDNRETMDLYRPVGDSRTTYAYPVGSLLGESGWAARLGLSKSFRSSKHVVFAPYLFASYGAVFERKDRNEQGVSNYTDLCSWGLGVECSVSRHVSMKAEYANPIGHLRRPSTVPKVVGEKRFVFSLSMTF